MLLMISINHSIVDDNHQSFNSEDICVSRIGHSVVVKKGDDKKSV